MSYRCKLCGREWEEIPAHAQQVGRQRGGYRMYLIDGHPHDIGSDKIGRNGWTKAAQSARENDDGICNT